jgi:hypothetical protein
MIGIIESALGIGMKYMESQDKKEQLALDTVKTMLESKTYRFVDAVVKLSYAAEQITKGLLRPLFSIGMFVYGLTNVDVMKELVELGLVGETAVAAIFGSAPAWGYSRHKEKAKKISKDDPDFD